jgi:hypothetical protein
MLLQSSQGSSSWGAGSLTNSQHLSVPPQPPPRFYSKVGFNNFFCSVPDPVCLSRIRIFCIPDPGYASKSLSILTQKIISKLLDWKYDLGYSPRIRIQILIFTYPGSRGQKGTGSRIWIRNADFLLRIWIRIFLTWLIWFRDPVLDPTHPDI